MKQGDVERRKPRVSVHLNPANGRLKDPSTLLRTGPSTLIRASIEIPGLAPPLQLAEGSTEPISERKQDHYSLEMCWRCFIEQKPMM